jgi:hypothetical protein
MNRLNEKQLKAIATLENDNDFGIFLMWLEESLESLRDSSDFIKGNTELRISQGKRQILKHILTECADAKLNLEKIKGRNANEYQ